MTKNSWINLLVKCSEIDTLVYVLPFVIDDRWNLKGNNEFEKSRLSMYALSTQRKRELRLD